MPTVSGFEKARRIVKERFSEERLRCYHEQLMAQGRLSFLKQNACDEPNVVKRLFSSS